MKIDKMMKECLTPHAMVHSLTGLGVGLLLVGFLPVVATNAVLLGVAAVVIGVLADFAVNPAAKK